MDLQLILPTIRPPNQLVPGKYGASWYAVTQPLHTMTTAHDDRYSSSVAVVIVIALLRLSRFSFGGASWLSAL